MNRTLKLFIFVLILISCEEPLENDLDKYANYWGCWETSPKKIGFYDIILTERNTNLHVFEFGEDCEPINIGQYDAVFRNDTLIINNSLYEFWCFIKQDTLYYSVYTDNAMIEAFIKK